MAKLITVTGPRGAGKNTLLEAISKQFPHLRLLVAHTTRPPRPGEVNGKDYHFVSQEQLDAMQNAGELLWIMAYGSTQRTGMRCDEVFGSPRDGISHFHAPGVRLIRRLGQYCDLQVFSIAVLASEMERRKRIKNRQAGLTDEDVDRLIEDDRVSPDDREYEDFNLIIHNNVDGDPDLAWAVAIRAVREFLQGSGS